LSLTINWSLLEKFSGISVALDARGNQPHRNYVILHLEFEFGWKCERRIRYALVV